jgi:general stress protein YciG
MAASKQGTPGRWTPGDRLRHIGRGFASMDPERQREIASHGGRRAATKRGTAHEFTSEESAAAGSKGGQGGARARHPRHEFDSEEARARRPQGRRSVRGRTAARTRWARTGGAGARHRATTRGIDGGR